MTQLLHYELPTSIGAGGMGEVYKARDTRLGRMLAVKFLPEAFAQDRERLARLQREAQVLASLDHPNIAAPYGFEEAEGKPFLVMELAEGEGLDARVSLGPVPLDETIRSAFRSTPRKPFDLRPSKILRRMRFAATTDRKRFLMVQDTADRLETDRLVVVEHWLSEFHEAPADALGGGRPCSRSWDTRRSSRRTGHRRDRCRGRGRGGRSTAGGGTPHGLHQRSKVLCPQDIPRLGGRQGGCSATIPKDVRPGSPGRRKSDCRPYPRNARLTNSKTVRRRNTRPTCSLPWTCLGGGSGSLALDETSR